MHLTFVVDPAVCIQLAYKYLEEGPDVFHQTVLRVQLTMRYKLIDRSIILTRLYALAQKLALPGLMDMAFGVLSGGDDQIKAEDCLTLSSLVFAKTAAFDKKIKDWCFEHVKTWFPVLSNSDVWLEAMWNADLELRQKWSELVEVKASVLGTVDEATEDKEMDHSEHTFSGEHNRDSSSGAASKEQAFQEVLDEIKPSQKDFYEPLEEPVTLPTSPGNIRMTPKLGRWLGTDESPPIGLSKEESLNGISRSPSLVYSPGFGEEHYKARYVQGYPGTERQADTWRRASMSSFVSHPQPTPTKPAGRLRLFAVS